MVLRGGILIMILSKAEIILEAEKHIMFVSPVELKNIDEIEVSVQAGGIWHAVKFIKVKHEKVNGMKHAYIWQFVSMAKQAN